MSIFRPLLGATALLAVLLVPTSRAAAQGVTTGGVTGTISDASGAGVEGVQVQVRNARLGVNVGTASRSAGNYIVQGLAPDAGYTITVRRIGYTPVTRSIQVSLGQVRREDFRLTREAAQLAGVAVIATATDPVINASKTGATTTISDSALSRLPTINRNFSDFVQLVPQVSTSGAVGQSGGGVNLRQNAIQIDGAQSGDMFGLGTSGQPGSQANAKSIPLDAVKEYQVLLSPFDVRQGNFGGLLINAVTKGGTNEFHGSAYGYTRGANTTRTQPYLNYYSQQNYGGTIGGPIIPDKLFFFGSAEVQERNSPTSGSYVGAPDQFVSEAAIADIQQRAATFGLADAGTGEQLQIKNPLRNYFIRLDANLPLSTRLVVRNNYAAGDRTSFGRSSGTSAGNPNFTLTSNKYEFSSTTNSIVGELLTNLPHGLFNELLLNRSTTKDFRTVPVKFPQITVQGITRSDNPALPAARFVFGTEASSQGNSLDQQTVEVTDNLTIPVGSHAFTLGTKNLFYKSINLFANNSLGNWTFTSPTAFSSGTASTYTISAPAPTDPYFGLATIRANMYGLYAQDVWTATPRLTITGGIRWDKPAFQNVPPQNDSVLSQYKRNTSVVPTMAQISPRLGFNWDVTGDQVNQLRGGIGAFSGSVPFVYLSNAFGNSGLSGFSSLTCGNNANGSANATPIFSAAAASSPPTACDRLDATGVRTVGGGAAIAGPAAGAAVATIDPDFKFPKYLKGSLGFDRRIGNGWIATLEGLYTKSLQDAFYQNLALSGPVKDAAGNQVYDRNGRVLYGILRTAGALANTFGQRTQVLDVTNASGNYTYSITGQVQKSFADNFEGSAAYTFMRARDVVSITSSTQGSNYRYQRDVSGFLEDRTVTKSKYDQPHRLIATGTYRFPTATDVSFIYTGNSGSPYDYVYGSSGAFGDLNADGQTQNDLVYVPKNALDPNEILFAGAAGTPGSTAATQATALSQAQAFENFINNTPCLAEARGTILTRNACRNPWVNQVDVSFAQNLERIGGARFGNLQARLDVINFGNLLNRNWGKQAFSDQNSTCGAICSATPLLTHTGFVLPAGTPVGGNSPNAQGTYTFSQTYQAFNSDNLSSNYTMQFSLRYSF